MIVFPYNRTKAVDYARRWALARNPNYYDFTPVGGDCTNFASQCLFAGSGVMNYTPVTGWYYKDSSHRTASWSGVNYLYEFLTRNKGEGPFAEAVSIWATAPGDFVQLGRENGTYYHTLVITSVTPEIRVAAHSYDALDRPLAFYRYAHQRALQIQGVRKMK